MGESDGTYRKGYQKGYRTGRKTGEEKGSRKQPPLSADEQKKDLNDALKRLRGRSR